MSLRPVHEKINDLSEGLVQLSDKVVGNLVKALQTVRNQDEQEAHQIRKSDHEIDCAEVDLEERCLAFLALQQPVAGDLRTIVTIIKINDDLERIGDLAVHVVDRMPEINPALLDMFAFERMGFQAADMVKKSIDAFVLKDKVLADNVCALDEEIDVMHRAVFKKVAALLKSPDSDVDQLIAALSISRYLERMADHASRIAHEVIFLATGEIVRHKSKAYEKLVESLKN